MAAKKFGLVANISIVGIILTVAAAILFSQSSTTRSLGFASKAAKSSLSINPGLNQVYFGAWLNTGDSSPKRLDGDRPYLFQERTGLKPSFYHFVQFLPLEIQFPLPLVTALNDDAFILLTVLPKNPWEITDDDIIQLGLQFEDLDRLGRRIVVRFAHEMNGIWYDWSMSPTRYVNLWRRVYTISRRYSNNVQFMWAPNQATGHPFGYDFDNPRIVRHVPADLEALDTNGDGVINNFDDAYSPFFPGIDYVDWVGLSSYSYGPTWNYGTNYASRRPDVEFQMNFQDFYDTYAESMNKPFAFPETAAPTFVNSPFTIDSELQIKSAWWRQFMTNSTFLDRYPRVSLVCLFEFLKFGDSNIKDYRITNSTEVLQLFLNDLEAVKGRYLWANSTVDRD